MTPEERNNGLTLIAILVAGAAAYGIDWNFLSGSKITHYAVMCRSEMKGTNCPTEWERLSKTLYSVNADQQTVVSQSEGQPPQRLANCAVIDKKNWKCKLTSTSAAWEGFTNGTYWDGFEVTDGAPPQPFNISGIKTVARWEWLIAERARK